jgi:hypothetical protein
LKPATDGGWGLEPVSGRRTGHDFQARRLENS